MPIVRSAYSPRVQVVVPDGGPSRTKQSFVKECNVNNIMARFIKTGAVAHINQTAPRYGEVPHSDFKAAMDTVAHANSIFEGLPSNLRKRFDNDPGAFLAYVQDDSNAKEMAELGLIPVGPPTDPDAITPGESQPQPAPPVNKDGEAVD